MLGLRSALRSLYTAHSLYTHTAPIQPYSQQTRNSGAQRGRPTARAIVEMARRSAVLRR